MQLHVANEHLPADSPAKPLVTRVLALMKQGIDEGRTTLKGLRSSASHIADLGLAFSRIQEELGYQKPIAYRVTVEGPAQPLLPIIRDEIYRIGREALVNAFRHSRATSIEVVLEYGVKQLRILIRDNGCGINPQVLNSGREGHWGLSGMRERAEEIGARLRLWSGSNAGTEVELFIPGHLAFATPPAAPRRRWFSILPRRADKAAVTSNEKPRNNQDSSP
jgi:signal transduction histidine kinase